MVVIDSGKLWWLLMVVYYILCLIYKIYIRTMTNRKVKYFGFYCVFLILIILVCTYIVSMKEQFLETSIHDKKYSEILYDYSYNYHLPEEEIRKQYNHKLNVIYVKDDNGKYIGKNMEKTQSLPTYYEPGTFQYTSAAYIPTYEDAVQLSHVKSRI